EGEIAEHHRAHQPAHHDQHRKTRHFASSDLRSRPEPLALFHSNRRGLRRTWAVVQAAAFSFGLLAMIDLKLPSLPSSELLAETLSASPEPSPPSTVATVWVTSWASGWAIFAPVPTLASGWPSFAACPATLAS